MRHLRSFPVKKVTKLKCHCFLFKSYRRGEGVESERPDRERERERERERLKSKGERVKKDKKELKCLRQ